MKRLVRSTLVALGALLGLALGVALAIVGTAEWNYRAAVRAPHAPNSFRIDGAGQGPVLILLHGAGLNGRMWDGVRRHLDPADRVIALDLPGHGAHRDEAFSLEGAAATVAAAAMAVAPAPVLLVGDSLGGYSAIAAAASLPREQLRGLVLAGCSANFDSAAQWPRYALDLASITVLSWLVDEADFVRRALALLGVAEADRPAIVAAGVSLPAVPQAGRALIGVDMRAMLAAIDVPVLIVNGAQDSRAVAQEASFVAAARRGASLRFENTGHGVSMRRPAEFARVIDEFAARQATRVAAAQGAMP